MITKSELKSYLKIENTTKDYDNLFDSFILTATNEINSICNQHIAKGLTTINFVGAGETSKLIKEFPVTELSSVASRTTPSEAWTALLTTDFTIYESNNNYFCYSTSGFTSGSHFQLAYNSGYDIIPNPIKQICIEMCAVMFKESSRGDARLGVQQDGENLQGVSNTKVFKPINWFDKLRVYRIPTI